MEDIRNDWLNFELFSRDPSPCQEIMNNLLEIAKPHIFFSYKEISIGAICDAKLEFFKFEFSEVVTDDLKHFFQIVNFIEQWLFPFDIRKVAAMMEMNVEKDGYYEVLRAAIDNRIICETRISYLSPSKGDVLEKDFPCGELYEYVYLIVDREEIFFQSIYDAFALLTVNDIEKRFKNQIKKANWAFLKFDSYTSDKTYCYNKENDEWELVFEGPGFA